MIAPYMGSLLTVVVPNSTHLTTACPWVDAISIFDPTLFYFDSSNKTCLNWINDILVKAKHKILAGISTVL